MYFTAFDASAFAITTVIDCFTSSVPRTASPVFCEIIVYVSFVPAAVPLVFKSCNLYSSGVASFGEDFCFSEALVKNTAHVSVVTAGHLPSSP